MSNLSLKCLIETNKLTGSNFTDWLRCLRLVLRLEKIEYVLDNPITVIPDKQSAEYASFDEAAHKKHVEDATSAQCSLYASEAQTMEYEILRDLFKCKLHDGGQVSDHVLKMIGLIESLCLPHLKTSL
ncbi:uncharacterized protein LOC131007595 [Salvia miltiorrhiza]|uniref:uncharacterized protein LOC131007595 n=1 Tax=Salvia miltiorrhiza TaxID=226208 RepID=UPI0025ACB936|nr:uncharacterized protein LOC131007595 [Salvia miltiorrhiza]